MPPPGQHRPPPPPPPPGHHRPPPPPPPPPPPTTGLLRFTYKKPKVLEVVRSVFRSCPIMSPTTCITPLTPLTPFGRLVDGLGHGHGHQTTNCVTGTLYGYRNGCVTLVIQENPKTPPITILELEIETDILQTEMILGVVRIVLECEKEAERLKVKLLDEPLWRMFFNGKKGGLGVKREANEVDLNVIELLRPVSMGSGVLPERSGGPDGEMTYMRAHFDRVVGSKDLETLYMMSPDGRNGPELSIFFVRI